MNNVIRVVIRITHPWAGTLLLICFLVGLTLSASVIAPELRSSQQAFPAAAFIPSTAGRHFYVTYATYAPGTAPTACSAGYHMASVWEILDVSDLAYDYNQPDAKTVADSGFGPPSNWYGWVRTGNDASSDSTAGTGNCRNWSSVSPSDYGSAVSLAKNWQTASGHIPGWDAASFTCDSAKPVWCVGDFHKTYLPLILK